MLLKATAVLAAVLISTSATAATLEYDCDTAPEHFSELKRPFDSARGTVSGTITPRAMAKSKAWAATGSAAIISTDGSTTVKVRLTGVPTMEKTIVASIIVTKDGKDDEISLGTVTLMQEVPFSLELDGSGIINVSLDKWSRKIPVVLGDKPIAQIVCSTGEFLFRGLVLGG